MPKDKKSTPWDERQVPLQDIVLSNSWALQAILQYLEEIQPGAKDRIWEHYLAMKQVADEAIRKGKMKEAECEEIDEE